MDYRDFERKKGGKGSTGIRAGYWWQQEADEVWKYVMGTARELELAQRDRSALNLRCARLYGNFDFLGFGPREYGASATFSPIAKSSQISWNVIASCVDTLDAKLSKSTPRAAFLTESGNWCQKMAAKKLDAFQRGFFYESKAQELLARQTKDGFILDLGAIHAYIDWAAVDAKGETRPRVKLERVLAPEFRWDEAEAVYGTPRQLFRVKVIAKEVVRATWGKKDNGHLRGDILRALAKSGQSERDGKMSVGADMVEVVEAWHLESAPGAGDGMHALCVEGANLIEPEKWTKERFPFSFFRFSDRMQGFSGQSLAERLTGRQLEINRTLQSISEVLRRKGRGRVWVPRGAKIILSHLTNGIGDICEYDGAQPPTHDTAPVVAQEDIAWVRQNWDGAFEESGISQLSAAAKNPFGADPSGKALELYNDIESERFIMVGKRREAQALDLTELAISLVKDVVEETGKEYEVVAPEKAGVSHVSWKEVDLERDDYIMQMFPVSSLAQTFAAKVAQVEKLANIGALPPGSPQMMRLLDMPDLSAEDRLSQAALDYVDAVLYEILEGDKPEEWSQPSDFCDFELLVKRGQQAYLRAKIDGAPEKRLALLSDLLLSVAEKLGLKPPDPDPNAMPQPGPPGMAGMPMDPGMGAPAPGGPPGMPALPPGMPPPGGMPPIQ